MSGTLDLVAARSLLCEQLWRNLEALPIEVREDVVSVLSGEGKLLHQPASLQDGRWALLPFYLACDLCPDIFPPHACAVALAMECVVCATDLLDNAMTDEMTPLVERLGMVRVLDAAMAFVYLVQRIFLSLTHLKNSVPLLDIVQQAMLAASAGQQRDVLIARRPTSELSQKECIEIAAARGGTLSRLACELGAICAGVDANLQERCAEMGHLLGIATQLDNDAQNFSLLLQPQLSKNNHSTWLMRTRKTLPLVLAVHVLRRKNATVGRNIEQAFQQLAALTGEEREHCVNAVREGITETWNIAASYRERARDYLGVIECNRPVSPGLRQVLGLSTI